MRFIQKSFLLALCLLTTINFTWAQGKKQGNPTERVEKQTDRMIESLGLNDEQAAQVKAINLKYAGEYQAVYQNTMDKTERRAQMQQINAEREAELATILTPDQLAQMETLKEDRKQKMRGRKAKNMDPGKIAARQTAHMTEKLALSETQAQQVEAINLKYAEQSKALIDDESVEQQDKKNGMKEIRNAHKAELAQVLTPEQMETWESMDKGRKAGKGSNSGGHSRG